jgi:hypothetical protein
MAATGGAFSIDTFTSKLLQGGALASLFKAKLLTTIGTKESGSKGDFEFLCKATTLPGDTIDVATVTYMGRGINIPSNRAATQWTTTIYNDEYMATRNHVENWMEQLNSHRSNKRAAGMQRILDYTGQLSVSQLSKMDSSTETKDYVFMNAWPSAIGEIAVDWETNDIQTYDITWEFAYWKSDNSAVGMD